VPTTLNRFKSTIRLIPFFDAEGLSISGYWIG